MIPILLALAAAGSVQVRRSDDVPGARALPVSIRGRVEKGGTAAAPTYSGQWPGIYFETAFRGRAALFRVGEGDVTLHVRVDGADVARLVKPKAGLYRVDGLAAGIHQLRVEVASESQDRPVSFGGILAPAGTLPAPLPHRTRQIEFIGDSHTVGYGNTSPKGECTSDEVWATTDTSQGLAAVTARHYDADYQVNAISGRGVVRNYDGFAAPKLPEAYPFVLFDQKTRAAAPGWSPQVIVIGLGTNDFSTALHGGEQWVTRDALRADYEATYVRFVDDLHRRHPHARFVLWATDLANGEIEAEAAKVADRLKAGGIDTRFVPVNGLAFSGCHGHPSVADDQVIASKLEAAIDASATGGR